MTMLVLTTMSKYGRPPSYRRLLYVPMALHLYWLLPKYGIRIFNFNCKL